jgi:N-acetyltransferase
MKNTVEFEFQPTLVGDTVSLRPLSRDDFESLHQAAADPLIWVQHPEPTRYLRDVFERNFFNSAVASGSAFVVIDNATGQIIGSTRYYEWDAQNAEVAIGYTFIARSHWGGATNGEMKRLMLNHAFQWVKVVWLHIGKDNWRSRKAAEKIGAVFTHEEIKVINGQSRETAFYKIEVPLVARY